MARQVIDTTTNHGTYFGDPAKAAFEKINVMSGEIYDPNGPLLHRTGGVVNGRLTVAGPDGAYFIYDRTQNRYYAAYAQDGTYRVAYGQVNPLVPGVDLMTMDAFGNVAFLGSVYKQGVQGAQNFRIQNTGQQVGIGGSFVGWANERWPAMQVDAQVNTSAYMIARATNWGIKHLWGMDVYEGGSGTGAQVTVNFHFATGIQRHQFIDNGSMIIAGTLTQNSDYRIKTAVESIDPSAAAGALRRVRPIEYTDTEDNGKRPRRAGVIAHELQDVLPLLVHGTKDEVQTITVMQGDTTPYEPGMEPKGYEPPVAVERQVPKLQNVNYAGMAPYLAAAWQHSDARISELERERDELLQRVEALAGRLEALEAAA